MDERPHDVADEAGELHPEGIGDGGPIPDGRHRALSKYSKGLTVSALNAFNAACPSVPCCPCSMLSLLNLSVLFTTWVPTPRLRTSRPLATSSDGAPGGRPGQRQALGQCQLVFETITGCQGPVPDSGLDCLRELVVEGHRARPVELNRRWHVHSDLGQEPDESSCIPTFS